MFAGAEAGRYHGDHAGSALVSDEGVPQNLRQLRGSEGQVSPLHAKGADTFLESQQGFVDFCSLHSYYQNYTLKLFKP